MPIRSNGSPCSPESNTHAHAHACCTADRISLVALVLLVAMLAWLGPLPPAPGARAAAVADEKAATQCHERPDARCPCPARVDRILSIGMTVNDLDASVRFYTTVLDFERVEMIETSGEALEDLQGVFPARARMARLRLGDEVLELTEYLAPSGRPIPADRRSNDRDFQHAAIVVSNMDAAYARLRAHRVRHASSEPQTIPASNPHAGGIRAFYFRDPDGHALELIWFPPDRGSARWRSCNRLFLGIDHTAIVVEDTERSLHFYRDALGLEVAGASENLGIEQARLNAVAGAHLRITALRPVGDDGLGIELLEYLMPRDGRPAPEHTRSSDLWHWQVTAVVHDAHAAWARSGAARISPGIVETDARVHGFKRGALVRDPDGHAVRIVEIDLGNQK